MRLFAALSPLGRISRLSGSPSHRYHGRSEEPVVEPVAGPVFFDHRIRLPFGGFHHLHRFMLVGIEGCTQGLDFLDPVTLEYRQEPLEHQLDTFGDVLSALAGVGKCPLEVIDDRKQVPGQGLYRLASALGAVSLVTLENVLQLGLAAQQAVLVLIGLAA